VETTKRRIEVDADFLGLSDPAVPASERGGMEGPRGD
jgi:hypothetical protein